MPFPDDDKILNRIWSTLDDASVTLEANPRSTIKPRAEERESLQIKVQGVLDRLVQWEEAGLKGKLKVEGTLGQGGMGEVHLARQLTLNRPVAVKTLRSEHHKPHSAMKLLQEGWVTGAVEHPNVVPVHDIGVDADGYPLIVLKRIEGQDWEQLMEGEQDEQEARLGPGDPLEQNLRILIQVCNAVASAHSRGIVHRDLKPENIMIGEFGEVYVMDWGIAGSLEPDEDGRLPQIQETNSVVGTPSYIAPEMLTNPRSVDRRSDVYLLGAILFQLLSGNPPHQGSNLQEVFYDTLCNNPKLPDEAPAELAEVCARAMDRDPDARYQGAEQLKDALLDFLQHRGSIQLVRQAEQRLQQLEQTAAGEVEDEDRRRLRLYWLFAQCQFGFQEALKTWPDNRAADWGRRASAEEMVRYEIGQGDPRAAAALMSDKARPPELTRQLEQLQRARESEQQQLEAHARLGRQMDPNVGRRTRLALAAIIGVCWSLSPLLNALLVQDTPQETHEHFLLGVFALGVVALGLGVWARKSLMETTLNRRIVAAVVFLLLGEAILCHVCVRLDLSPVAGLQLQFFFWFCVASLFAITLEWRLLPSAALYLAGTFAVLAWPEGRYYLMSIANLFLTINAVLIWRSPLAVSPR